MAKIITYQGSMDALVWQTECKNLSRDAEVVVPVAHEAIFIKNGNIIDSFTMGRHYLKECNVGEGHLFSHPDEKIDCKIYYVKKEGTYNIKWETPTAISLEDPINKKETELCIGGVFAIKIIDAKIFLSRLITHTQTVSLDEVKEFFRQRMLFYIKDQLRSILVENQISIDELSEKLLTVSKEIEFKIRYLFESFGVSVENFLINKIEIKGKEPFCLKYQNAEQESSKNENDIKGEIMYCPSCGVDLPPLSVFCYKCGVKLQD